MHISSAELWNLLGWVDAVLFTNCQHFYYKVDKKWPLRCRTFLKLETAVAFKQVHMTWIGFVGQLIKTTSRSCAGSCHSCFWLLLPPSPCSEQDAFPSYWYRTASRHYFSISISSVSASQEIHASISNTSHWIVLYTHRDHHFAFLFCHEYWFFTSSSPPSVIPLPVQTLSAPLFHWRLCELTMTRLEI